MKTKLSLVSIKSRFVALLMLMLGFIAFGQNLVRYPLTNNLAAVEGPAAGMQITGVDMIKYMDPPNPAAATFGSNYMSFQNNGDELVLTFDATNYQGMSVQFRAGIGVFLAASSGNVKVYLKVGSGPDTLIDQANVSASWFGSDTHDFSPSLSGADHQSLVQIRIVGSSSSFGIFSYFGIQNLRIVADNTTMNVRRNVTGYPLIPYNADASTTLDTDFGSRFTNDTNNDQASQDKEYIITNTGSRTLKINNFTLSPNDQGFSIVSMPASTVSAGGTTTFRVRFSPQDQGLRIANVVMNSNAIPNNPFSFQVKGNAKSCNLQSVPIVVQNFETSGSNLSVSTALGNPNITGGNSNSPNPNTVSALFPGNTNLYASGSASRSLFVRGSGTDTNNIVGTGEVTLEFGPVDITNQQEVSVNFEVAAFGTTNSDSGVNGFDYVLLQVQNTDGSWSDEIRLQGSSNTGEYDSRSYKYGFGGAIIPESNYDGTLVTAVNTNSTKYGKFKLNIPVSALTNNFTFRIKAQTGRTRTGSGWPWDPYKYYNRNLWLIDNVHIDAGNAKFKTWSGSGWTGENTNRPGDREKAVFAGNYNFTASNNTTDLSVCECEVNNGAILTIPSPRTLTVRNKVVNHNTGDGSNFIVADGGNLIQIENDAVNTGNIEVRKAFTFSGERKQYNYVSSPTVGTNVKSIYTGTEDPTLSAMYYMENNDRFGNSNGAYIAGRALALQENKTGTDGTSANPAKFRGVPFNGTLDYPLAFTNAAHGYNLVGNPYPSALSIEELYEANLSAINSTFYFWDNRGNAAFTQAGSSYGGDSYAKYNAISSTGTGSGTKAPNAPDATRVPNGFVSPAQGFLVQAKAAGQVLKFSNTKMRVSSGTINFFGKSGAGTESEKDRYWLTLKAPSSIETMMAVVYFDRGQKAAGPEDSENSGSSDEIYSMVGVQGLSINGLPVFDNEDVVAVGYRAFAAGTHTISLFNREGTFNNGQSIYLKDKQFNTITDLTQGDYTFETQKGTFTNRFEILYKPQTILATDQTKSSSVMVYRDAEDFVVQSSDKKIDWVEVYDMSGRLYKTIKGGDNTVRFSAQEMAQGMYILKIVREGEVSSKRILK